MQSPTRPNRKPAEAGLRAEDPRTAAQDAETRPKTKIMDNEFLQIETDVVQVLRTIYDPEIPMVDIYELGLIYELDVNEQNEVKITMTLTAPNCPMADEILEEVEQKVRDVQGVSKVNLKLTFDPPWDQSMLSEEARLELGLI